MNHDNDETVRRVLSFWFGEPGADGSLPKRQEWFRKDPAFDAAIAEGFGGDCEKAARGDLDALMATAEGCLALLILLDQFPRNMFRGSRLAFATDGKAREVTRHALKHGFDAALAPVQRVFLYLPLEHSEDLADQERMVALAEALGDADLVDYAVRHRDIIARFGRFPHRNAALGRASTEEEAAFLQEPNSSF